MRLLALLVAVAAAASSLGKDVDAEEPCDCPFTLRIGGELVPVNEAPDYERYIIGAWTMAKRAELLELVAAAAELEPSDTEGLGPLTAGMPLLVGNLSRTALLWMCADPQAASCVEYVERDEQVSLV
ncbi:hypothetical protein ACK3TF_002317 [Chlorella vulgaris]